MRGHLASQDQSTEGSYSDLMVLRSAAGWYIGTTFYNHEGFIEPGTRESEYFATEEKAKTAFDSLAWTQRQSP